VRQVGGGRTEIGAENEILCLGSLLLFVAIGGDAFQSGEGRYCRSRLRFLDKYRFGAPLRGVVGSGDARWLSQAPAESRQTIRASPPCSSFFVSDILVCVFRLSLAVVVF
jgi:hypothetical protein